MAKNSKKNIMKAKIEWRNIRTKKAAISFYEAITMIISIFAFAFLVGGMAVGITQTVSAADNPVPKGCCTQAKDGSTCQEMNLADKDLCQGQILGTSCSEVEPCQVGCCYSKDEGSCSFNSPKEKCEQSGGNWSNSKTCNIPQCQLGCCMLGDQASITTKRECTKLSDELKFEMDFQGLDPDGTCNSRLGLSLKGACVTDSGDYSGEKDCDFTSKGMCKTGDFYEGYLCTSKELKTICKPARNTTCVEGKDQIYFLDSCGNTANVYDASKINDSSYWDKIIAPKDSCSPQSPSCGNCDYSTGSICNAYRPGKDVKAVIGDNVCRNLNCLNGKKHGESWCIYDYNPSNRIAPAGSRSFVAKCVEGELSISPCADFNNEVCGQNTDASNGRTEGRCFPNDWRTCLNANSKTSYDTVKTECAKYPQCMMFNDYFGSDNLKRSDGEYFAGFNPDKTNEEQGSSGDVGKDQNKVIAYCVPKYTPGFQFWDAGKNGTSYGGSKTETDALCSIGNFVCVSKTQRKCSLTKKDFSGELVCQSTAGISGIAGKADCGDWEDKDNWECNIDGTTQTIKTEDLPKLMKAYNERCRAIGSCGTSVNVAGEQSSKGFTISRMKVDEEGDTHKNFEEAAYNNTSNIEVSSDGIVKAGSMTKIPASMGEALTGESSASSTADVSRSTIDLTTLAASMDVGQESLGNFQSNMQTITGIIGILGGVGAFKLLGGGAGAGGAGANGIAGAAAGFGATLSGAMIGMMVGYYLGGMIAKNQGWSPGHQEAFINGMMGVGAALGAALVYIFSSTCSWGGIGCIAGVAIAILYSLYENCWAGDFDENNYYVLQFQCQGYQPPLKGECSLCNNDVRTCSEYRCRSLGLNCHYYNTNGEPGWCAELSEIWSAKITPWPEALTPGNKYTQVTDMKFKIEGATKEKVLAGEQLQFGIITDKPAVCKIDNKHTKSFDEMAVTMQIDNTNCETSGCSSSQGLKHKVALSPQITGNGTAESTLSLPKNAETNYYIRCRNFAGQTNEAEFAVKVITDNGEDMTPPTIISFSPIDGSYLKVGANSSTVSLQVNEPSECKYSSGVNNRYEDMTGSITCITDESAAVLGNWPCYATLYNLTAGDNKFYFACEDKPGLPNGSIERRFINRNSKEYTLKVCSTGLNITRVTPSEQLVAGKPPVSAQLQAETTGCVNGGDATCYYKFEAGYEIPFLDTDAKIHKQLFTSLSAGMHNITIICQDEAGNIAKANASINVYIDTQPPVVTRNYDYSNTLVVATDEKAECKYIQNSSIGCEFDYDLSNATLMDGEGLLHAAQWQENKNYFIKCRDLYNNTNPGCATTLKTYSEAKELYAV